MRLRFLVWYSGGICLSSLIGSFPSESHAAVFVEGSTIPADRLVLVDALTHAHRSCRELVPAPRVFPPPICRDVFPPPASGAAAGPEVLR